MKLIHGLFVFALALSLSSLSRAAEPVAPASGAPAVEPAAPAPEPVPEILPAEKKEPAVKSTPKKTKSVAKKADIRTEISPAESAVVKRNNSNVRGKPGFIGEVITKLKKGEPVTLLEEIKLGKTRKDEPASWYKIAMPANTPVWVSGHFVDPSTKTVTASRLQVRAGPGENYSVVGALPKGTEVKEIRQVNNWIEIETPADTYAFVSADLIDRTATSIAPSTPTEAPTPEPAPEVVAVPPDVSDVPTPAEPAVPAEPAAPAPTETASTEPAPSVEVTPAPVEEEPLPKRIVTREGIVRHSFNVQTPSYYELESPDTKKVINYLFSPEPDFSLKEYIGQTVTVTGEEYVDKRWPKTPVIKIDSLEQQ